MSCQFPAMPNISFEVEGIYKLLNKLNLYKSPGPDNVLTIILKYCAAEISSCPPNYIYSFNKN